MEKYHCHLLNFIHKLVRDDSLVEDIGQDVFISTYKSLTAFDGARGVPFSAWLFIIARNRCMSELRKIKKNREYTPGVGEDIPDKSKPADERVIEHERLQALKKSLEQLPEPFKATVLAGLQGYSIAEIADKNETSPGTVKTRLFRGREKLRQLFFNFYQGDI